MRSFARVISHAIKQLCTTGIRMASPCVLCGYELSEDNLCHDCRQACVPNTQTVSLTHIRHLRSGSLYQFPLHLLLHKYKYNKQQQLAGALSCLLLRDGLVPTVHEIDEPDIDAVVPVPLHSSKLRERGFNQSLPLARAVARAYGMPLMTNCIVRTRATAQQADCNSKKERLDNVSGAFATHGKCPERVLLVDDVVTTGATVSEIARVMKKSGTKRVDVLAVCVSHHLQRTARVVR